ncbi:hypothetical protein [Kordia sp.]|uniref:hypothetical protein n=1 Tax=Kordia sp. TaxID=1965332 RepID=UPI003D2B69CA
MKNASLIFRSLIILLILTNCSNDDDIGDPTIITEESLIYLHDNNTKRWQITSYYSSYKDLELNIEFTDCVSDDIYTFYVNDTNSDTEFGSEVCYNNFPNEASSASYNYNSEFQELYLNFSRGGYSSQDAYYEFFIAKCIFLTEEKMIFTHGGEDNSGVGLVFEKVN